jgi:hypothetical protein
MIYRELNIDAGVEIGPDDEHSACYSVENDNTRHARTNRMQKTQYTLLC